MTFPLQLNPGLAINLAAFLIAFCFGFVLERAGFGDSRRLAAQFYFHEQRVLKVMFTAIVTAMLLLFASSALGLLNFDLVYVNPTHLGPAIVGGLVLGVGFIIGGYCPGTSLVSAATGKIDGMFFVAGVTAGIVVFAESYEMVQGFFENTGNFGRLQLFEVFNVPPGVMVLMTVSMAVGVFWGAGRLERKFRNKQPKGYEL
jgi:uncharacterized membrane protein YedE/YeeE